MKKAFFILLVATSLVAAVVTGCTEKPGKKNVAVVNGEPIAWAVFDARVDEQLNQHAGQDAAGVDRAKLQNAILEQMVNERLLLQGAKEAALVVTDAEIDQQLDRIRRNYPDAETFQGQLQQKGLTEEGFRAQLSDRLLVSKFKASLADADSVTEEEMQKYYKNSPAPLMSPARVKMRMIQARSDEEVNAYATQVKEKGFDQLADELTEAGKAVVSRSDWVQPDTFSKATGDAVRDAKIGDVVGPLKGMGGWYLMLIEDKEDPKVESYEEAKDKVRNLVLIQKRQGQEHIWVMKKKETSTIEKFL